MAALKQRLSMVVIGFLLISTSLFGANLYFFDWSLDIVGSDGYTAVPFPGVYDSANDEKYRDLYNDLVKRGKPLSLMLSDDTTNPYDGSNPTALSTVMGYAPRLDFVFCDFEPNNESPEAYTAMYNATQLTINLVRNNPNPSIKSAFIGNYCDYPGALDYGQLPAWMDRTGRNNFYMSSGLNVAMPVCYMYECYSTHTWPSYWGADISPNIACALFWSPLEQFSTAKRNLPSGHLLIPWVAAFIHTENYTAPYPSYADCNSLIQHLRLRGADGFYVFAGSCDEPGFVYPDEQYRKNVLSAWRSLDDFFSGAGTPTIMNLPSDYSTIMSVKRSGLMWSGMYKNGRIKILISNLGNSAQSVSWTPLPNSNMPAQSPSVPAGTHMMLNYYYNVGVIIDPNDDVSITPQNSKNPFLPYTGDVGYGISEMFLKYKLDALKVPPYSYSTVINSASVKTVWTGSGNSYTDGIFAVSNDTWSADRITWVTKPAYGIQVDSTLYAAWGPMEFTSSALNNAVQQEANGDGVSSFRIAKLDGASNYSHCYYGQSYVPVNSLKMHCSYAQTAISIPTNVNITIDPSDDVSITTQNSKNPFLPHTGDGGYGMSEIFLQYNLTPISPRPGYRTIINSVSVKTIWTGSGNTYSDGIYSVTNDNWTSGDITWATKPTSVLLLDTTSYTAWSPMQFDSSSLTSFVQQQVNGDGIVSFRITKQDGAANYSHCYYGQSYVPANSLKLIVNYSIVKNDTMHISISPSDRGCISSQNIKESNYLSTGYWYGDCFSYLKYNLSGLLEAPAGFHAKIHDVSLYPCKTTSGQSYCDAIYAVGTDSWSYATLTYANKPAAGSLLETNAYPGNYITTRFSGAAFTDFIAQEAAGDKIVSLQLADVNSNGTDSHSYYAVPNSMIPYLWVEYSYINDASVTASSPADTATGITIAPTLTWVAGPGAVSHDIYFGTDPANVMNATHASPEYKTNQTSLSFTPGALNVGTIYYWRVDEVGPYTTVGGAVLMFTTVGPAAASNPNPLNSSTNVTRTPTLSWTNGTGTTSCDIYLGTNQANVTNATHASVEYKGNTTNTSFAPGTLISNTMYFWRIDGVGNNVSTKGTVWNFTTN